MGFPSSPRGVNGRRRGFWGAPAGCRTKGCSTAMLCSRPKQALLTTRRRFGIPSLLDGSCTVVVTISNLAYPAFTGSLSLLLCSGVRTFTHQASKCHQLLCQSRSVLLRTSASPKLFGLPSSDGCAAALLASAPAAPRSPAPVLASVTTRGGVAGLGIAEKNTCPASRWPRSFSTGASGFA